MKYAGFFIVVGFSACLLARQGTQYPTFEENDWVQSRFDQVLDDVFPIEPMTGLSLGYRSYRDLYTADLEYTFLFNRLPPSKSITVTVKKPEAASLYDQIMTIHRKNPELAIEAIVPMLKVDQWRLSEDTCPTVRRQYDRFYNLGLTMLSAKDKKEEKKRVVTITLHPRVHIFRANISGGQMNLKLTDPGHPYVEWADQTRLALDQCIAKTE